MQGAGFRVQAVRFGVRGSCSFATNEERFPTTTAADWTALTSLEHDDAPAPETERPGQGEHCAAPAFAKVPATHVTHDSFEVAPGRGEEEPFGHAAQTPVPFPALYVPASHTVQALGFGVW